jgi:hypothetical protein
MRRDLDEARRIDRLETVVLARLARGRQWSGSIAVHELAATVFRRQGRTSVRDLPLTRGGANASYRLSPPTRSTIF